MDYTCFVIKAFDIYMPLFLIILLILGITKEGYSFLKHDISDLGYRLPGIRDEIFTLFLFLTGLFIFIINWQLFTIIYPFWYGKVILVCNFLMGIGFLGVSLTPENIRGKAHIFFAGLLFGSRILGALFSFILYVNNDIFPNYLIIADAFLIVTTVLFGIAEYHKLKKCKCKLGVFKFINFCRGLWEWSTFWIGFVWILLIARAVYCNLGCNVNVLEMILSSLTF
jgi:hypothetical protein